MAPEDPLGFRREEDEDAGAAMAGDEDGDAAEKAPEGSVEVMVVEAATAAMMASAAAVAYVCTCMGGCTASCQLGCSPPFAFSVLLFLCESVFYRCR